MKDTMKCSYVKYAQKRQNEIKKLISDINNIEILSIFYILILFPKCFISKFCFLKLER